MIHTPLDILELLNWIDIEKLSLLITIFPITGWPSIFVKIKKGDFLIMAGFNS